MTGILIRGGNLDTQMHKGSIGMEGGPPEDKVTRGWPSASQGERPQRRSTILAMYLELQPQNL